MDNVKILLGFLIMCNYHCTNIFDFSHIHEFQVLYSSLRGKKQNKASLFGLIFIILFVKKGCFGQKNKHIVKGTLTRDFLPLVFYIKQLPLGPWDTG
jgi:hypothetical protein